MRKKFKYCTYFYNIYSQLILRLIYKVGVAQEHKRKEKYKEKRELRRVLLPPLRTLTCKYWDWA